MPDSVKLLNYVTASRACPGQEKLLEFLPGKETVGMEIVKARKAPGRELP
jgi:hypothetical protein